MCQLSGLSREGSARAVTVFCSLWQTLDGRIIIRSHARVSSLTLKDIQYTDAGEYVCTASNTIGQDSQAMYLEVQCKCFLPPGGCSPRWALPACPGVGGVWGEAVEPPPFGSEVSPCCKSHLLGIKILPLASFASSVFLHRSSRGAEQVFSSCPSAKGSSRPPWRRGRFPFPILDSLSRIEVDSSQGILTVRLLRELGWLQLPSQMCFSDAPKLQGPVAVYTWEGNQVNITCEVFAYPSAVISWFRDGQLLPSSNYSNIKIYNTPSASYLEVRTGQEGSVPSNN